MKSRKIVSRKKTALKTRRARGRRRTKRGGMPKPIPTPIIQSLRTFMIHDIRPLLSTERITYTTGYDPKPSDHSVTKANERFYRTFADIPAEDGIKESIRNLYEELNNPVKNADKTKSITKYDEIMKKLDEEERKQSNQSQIVIKGKSFTSSPTQTPISNTSLSSDVSSSTAGITENILRSFINPPFSSPDIKRYPLYSSDQGTPLKPPLKSELNRPTENKHDGDGDNNDPTRMLFVPNTP